MSRESTEQGRSGRQGAEAAQEPGTGKQARQGSRRVEQPAEAEPKHSFAPGEAPSEQGERSTPGPERIKENQQGLAGGGTGKSGSHAGGERSEERAQPGTPGEGHARPGRRGAPGNREPS